MRKVLYYSSWNCLAYFDALPKVAAELLLLMASWMPRCPDRLLKETVLPLLLHWSQVYGFSKAQPPHPTLFIYCSKAMYTLQSPKYPHVKQGREENKKMITMPFFYPVWLVLLLSEFVSRCTTKLLFCWGSGANTGGLPKPVATWGSFIHSFAAQCPLALKLVHYMLPPAVVHYALYSGNCQEGGRDADWENKTHGYEV